MGGAVAEELAEGLLVIGDAVLLDQSDDVCGSEAGERGFGEVRVGGEEVFGAAVDVGEVAAAAAGDEDLFAGPVRRVRGGGRGGRGGRFDGAHQAGGAGSEYYDIHLLRAHLLWDSPSFMMA